jgi:predicted aspartyl protease
MNGRLDDARRVLIPISVRHATTGIRAQWEAWVDTAFTGELLLTPDQVVALELPMDLTIEADLADGSHVRLRTYTCLIEWFGTLRLLILVLSTGSAAIP